MVAIRPRAQAILCDFTPADPSDYYFSPRRAVERFHAERGERRVTPRFPSHVRRNANKRAKPATPRHAAKYTVTANGRAVARAIERANREYVEAGFEIELHVSRWHPDRLRHTHATEVRKRFGLKAAQVAPGHAHAAVTEVYAEKNPALAAKVAAEMG